MSPSLRSSQTLSPTTREGLAVFWVARLQFGLQFAGRGRAERLPS
jgi:hypothetical protein